MDSEDRQEKMGHYEWSCQETSTFCLLRGWGRPNWPPPVSLASIINYLKYFLLSTDWTRFRWKIKTDPFPPLIRMCHANSVFTCGVCPTRAVRGSYTLMHSVGTIRHQSYKYQGHRNEAGHSILLLDLVWLHRYLYLSHDTFKQNNKIKWSVKYWIKNQHILLFYIEHQHVMLCVTKNVNTYNCATLCFGVLCNPQLYVLTFFDTLLNVYYIESQHIMLK